MKRKQNELFKVNVWLKEDYLRMRFEMDRGSWERRNSDIALYETNQQFESQRLALYQANQWTDHAHRDHIKLFEELNTKNRIYQEKTFKRLTINSRITKNLL